MTPHKKITIKVVTHIKFLSFAPKSDKLQIVLFKENFGSLLTMYENTIYLNFIHDYSCSLQLQYLQNLNNQCSTRIIISLRCRSYRCNCVDMFLIQVPIIKDLSGSVRNIVCINSSFWHILKLKNLLQSLVFLPVFLDK